MLQVPHNLAHLLYELRRKAGKSDFLSEESVTVIRQAALKANINIVVQSQARGEGHTAAEFVSANSEHLNVTDDGALEVSGTLTPEWTIAGWWWRTAAGGASDMNVCGKWDSGQEQFKLTWESLAARFRFFANTSLGEQSIQSDAVTNVLTWYSFIIWSQKVGTGNTLFISVNDATPTSGTGNPIIAGTGDFEIGSEGGSAEFADMLCNRVGFWNRVLTAAERTEFHSDGQGIQDKQMSVGLKVGLKAFWNMYESSGQRSDAVGANNLTDVNTVTQDQTGPKYYVEESTLRRNYCTNPSFEHDLTNWTADNTAVGQSALFTLANSEYLSIASNSSLQTGDIDILISGHFKLTTKTTAQSLVSKTKETGDLREFELLYSSGSDRFRFAVSATGASSFITVDADNLGAVSAGTEYFIVAWHDKNANTINIQVDDGTIDTTAHSLGMTPLTAEFRLGGNDGTFPIYYNGTMRAVGIWKRILSSKEKTFLYNGGAGMPHAGLGLIGDGYHLHEKSVAYWDLDEASGVRFDKHAALQGFVPNDLTDNNTVTQAAGIAGFTANGRDDSQSDQGGVSLKLALVNIANTGRSRRTFTHTGAVESDVWSVSVRVRVESLTNALFRLQLRYLDSGGGTLATHNVDTTTVSTDWATITNENRTAPASTDKVYARVTLNASSNGGYGVVHVDSLLLEKVASIGDYFDGDSEKSFWEGTLHASENIKDPLGKAAIAGFFTAS